MIFIADNLHALNPIVSEAMRTLDPRPVQELALRCEQAGATLLDINPGYLSRRRVDRMAFLVEAVQEASSLRLVLDSPDAAVLEKGLEVCRETPILNALSLEPHKLEAILPLAVAHGTPLVLLLMDEKSFTPPRMEEKIALALELREHALSAGLDPEALIFDPVLPNLRWPDAPARVAEAVKTIRMLSSGAIFQEPAQTMVGLSNLRSGLKTLHPLQVETTCLSLFAGAGLDFVLGNALEPDLQAAFRLIDRMTSA